MEEDQQRYPDTDRVRFSLSSPGLDHDIWIPFGPPSELTLGRVMESVEKVLQSNRRWLLEDAMTVEFVHAALPRGGGRGIKMSRLAANFENMLKKKKCFIRVSPDAQNLCCARALVLCKAHADGENVRALTRAPMRQRDRAAELMRRAGIPLGTLCGVEQWRKFQAVLRPEYGIVVVSRDHYNRVIYNPEPGAAEKLILYHVDNHFHGIRTLKGFYGRDAICPACLKSVRNLANHRCEFTCFYCTRVGSCAWMDAGVKCHACSITFPNPECLENHRVICQRRRKCADCGAICDSRKNHKCRHRYCPRCHSYRHVDHDCYVQKLSRRKDESARVKYVFYDFESMTVEGGLHRPNLCVANVVCTQCMHVPIAETDACDCDRRQLHFRGENARDDFCDHLLGGDYAGAVCLAHNASRYDSHFILKYALERSVVPEVVTNGLKLMSLTVGDVKFIDSCNFLPMPLSKLPKAFGLTELRKGYFPHRFNVPENQTYVGPYPPPHFYSPEHMRQVVRDDFEAWHRQRDGELFDFRKELEAYCESDVDILQRACGVFRKLFCEYSGLEPFRNSLTISSACNRVYRTNFLKDKEIALIPPKGVWRGNQSSIALCWLTSEAERWGVPIRHSGTSGEVLVEGRRVDGLYERTVWNFLGCFWHGCPTCYTKRDTVNAVNGLTMLELFDNTVGFEARLRGAGYRVIGMWECVFRKEMARDAALKALRVRWLHVDPLQPREAFYGGRVNALKLYHEAGPSENIRYFDFCSLYPYINKYGRYVAGVPEKLRGSEIPESLEGLLKCRILPPRNLYIPVLPYRSPSGKLTFPLCRACVEDRAAGTCEHADERDRALLGTWTTDEIRKAVSLGYRILDKYEGWHFAEVRQYDPRTRSGGVWSEFIDNWMKLKIQASGYPREVGDDVDAMGAYVRRVFEKEGVRLDPTLIEKNEGLRTLAKLILNR